MTKEDALSALQSAVTRERLRGALYFVENGSGDAVGQLQVALTRETDTYVRRRLEQALSRRAPRQEPVEDSRNAEPYAEGSEAQLARAFEWVGGVFTHEIEGPIGRVAYRASREIPEYEASKTKREIEYLKDVFEGISQLVVASRAPRPEEFDLAALIDEIAESEAPLVIVRVARHGPRPSVVLTDKALLRLAIMNGIKNAVEAVESVGLEEDHAITITWGLTDRDTWVSVMDRGPGLQAPALDAFRIGTSTKAGHSGFGLAIARRAIESLGGTVTLEPQAGGGARYLIRWERK